MVWVEIDDILRNVVSAMIDVILDLMDIDNILSTNTQKKSDVLESKWAWLISGHGPAMLYMSLIWWGSCVCVCVLTDVVICIQFYGQPAKSSHRYARFVILHFICLQKNHLSKSNKITVKTKKSK